MRGVIGHGLSIWFRSMICIAFQQSHLQPRFHLEARFGSAENCKMVYLDPHRSLSKGTGKRGHIVAHDISWAAQTGKHLLRTQNVSEQNQKHFSVCNNVALARKRGNICAGNNVSATMFPRLPVP